MSDKNPTEQEIMKMTYAGLQAYAERLEDSTGIAINRAAKKADLLKAVLAVTGKDDAVDYIVAAKMYKEKAALIQLEGTNLAVLYRGKSLAKARELFEQVKATGKTVKLVELQLEVIEQ